MPKKRETETNHWQVNLCETCYKEPCEFCKACMCPCAYAGCQRYDLLDHNLENYVCCAGLMGDCLNSCTKPCPGCCLVVEVSLCCWMAISANRAIIQNTYGIRNTKCENFLIIMAGVCSIAVCLASICIELPVDLDLCIDCCYLGLSACFQSQQHAELRYQTNK
jgi:hypothetical protein